MDCEIVTLRERKIAGLCVRTGNFEPDVTDKIGRLWQKLFSGAIAEIPGRRGKSTYGLYTNYENDVTGAYDIVVGCEVDHFDSLPGRFTGVVIPAGRYAKFTFHGDAQKDVAGFWTVVWNTPLNRKYTCDFEEYPPCGDPQNAEINIYIALTD